MHYTKISPEFECQGQRSKVKVTRDKKMPLALLTPPGAYEWYALAANNVQQHRRAHFVAVRSVFGCRPPVLRRWENQRMLSS